MSKNRTITSRRLRLFLAFAMFTANWLTTGMSQAQDASGASPSSRNIGVPPATESTRGDISSDSLKAKSVELWNTPSLEGSDLKAADVIPGDVDIVDGVYTHEVTRVQWRPADPIDLYIVKPVGVKNPPVILYLYSYPFETDRFLNHDFCKFLVRNGYSAIGFASALTGQRYHTPRPMKEWFVSQLPESLATTAHDVQMILTYMASRGDVDMNRVGIFGDGSGATIAILAAAVDPRIKTLDLLDPWGDWPDWIKESARVPGKERPDYLKPDWMAAVAPLDPVKWLPKLKTPNVRIQFIKDVLITPADVQQKIEAAIPSGPDFQIVHYDNTAAFRAAIAGGTGFDWIKQKMQFRVVPDYSESGKPRGKFHPSTRKTHSNRLRAVREVVHRTQEIRCRCPENIP